MLRSFALSSCRTATLSCANNRHSPSTSTAEEELQALQEMMEPAPEGSSPPLLASAPLNLDPELAALENMLVPSALPLSAQLSAPANLSHRFPLNRTLPQGFSLSRAHVASPPHPGSSSNPFGATPLHIPENFSPSKVQSAKAPSPIPAEEKKKKSRKPKVSMSGTRTSARSKPQLSYAEKDETEDDNE
jgi:hypothetical protein